MRVRRSVSSRNLVEIDEEVRARPQRVAIRLAAREQRSALIRVVARLGNDRDAARLEIREREMRDAFLRSDERHDLGERIDAKPEALLHPRRDRLAKRHEPEPESVAAHRRRVRRLRQRFDRLRRRREVRVAGAEVDHVDAARDELALFLRNRGERILGKRLKSTGELGH